MKAPHEQAGASAFKLYGAVIEWTDHGASHHDCVATVDE